MMKCGAPPDKVLYRMFSQAELISKGYNSLVPGLISIFFRDMGPFKIKVL